MRTDEQLIQSAIATKDMASEDIKKLDRPSKYFNLYCVNLPEKFKGLPTPWYFGILPDDTVSNINRQEIVNEARDLIKDCIHDNEVPLVFISADRSMDLKTYLQKEQRPIFFLVETELPGRDNMVTRAKDAPILQAARAKYENKRASYELSPYLPNKPVNNWRFFGRKNEIQKLVESRGNFFVIGARRIGKTSLLQEVRRQLEKQHEITFWIKCQYKESIGEIVDEIASNLPARDQQQVLRSKKPGDVNFLITIIKRLKGEHKQIVLFFDEIGNAIAKDLTNDSWRFIGALRELSHGNEIRCIFSAFQETIIKQLKNFEGPFVNFGTTLKIYPFKKAEIEELVISPLHFWGNVHNKKELSNRIRKDYGSHPLILQYLGEKLFQSMTVSEDKYVDDTLKDLDSRDNLKLFEQAYNEIYLKIDYLERYVFLKICIDIEAERKDFGKVEINQENIKEILVDIGIKSDLDSRELFLERLNLRGLLSQDPIDNSVYRIDCPILYTYIKNFNKPDRLLLNYIGEIDMEVLDISKLKW